MYVSQNGCEDAKMKAFLGMNRIISINKLPSIEHYWSTENYIVDQGLRDVMNISIFEEILRNIHFSVNDTTESNDKGNKV